MQSAKETASHAAASARAGMEKTKATMQEKAERMTTRDPLQKDMATDKKEGRIHEAERQKQDTRGHNAAARQAAAGGGMFGQDYTTGGDYSNTNAAPGIGNHASAGTGYTADREYTEGTNLGGGVGPEDPNVVRGARGGYGYGNTN